MVTIQIGYGDEFIPDEDLTRSGVSVIDVLEDTDIFSIKKLVNGMFRIEARGYDHFGAYLTKDQILLLADEFRELANSGGES